MNESNRGVRSQTGDPYWTPSTPTTWTPHNTSWPDTPAFFSWPLDHDAMAPDVTIYTTTPEGVLSPGDYYLWPLLHDTSERLRREIEELAQAQGRHSWHYNFRRLRKWQRRIPLLTTLIRIRKAAIQALCTWDLTHTRPRFLTVINTSRDLTGLTVDEAVNIAAGTGVAGISSPTATTPL